MSRGQVHPMPFGAELSKDGSARFRLWAPDAERVDLCTEDDAGPRIVNMGAGRNGWFELETADAPAGTLYRYRINGELLVPDPASRFQPQGVNGPSEVIDASAYDWQRAWQGRPWHEAVVYELHVGTFTPGGTFESAQERLGHLSELGVTAVEVMPVATFAGNRNWGYDGVLPYAPHAAYGRPDQFRTFVDAAHEHGIMVLLDVVYNHFGPEGNHLHSYASPFFTARHQTPWGDAINYDGELSRNVRDYFLHNALYWLEEYRLDGLRLDAVHAIIDDSNTHILDELADAVLSGPGGQRQIHLVLENYDNEASFLKPAAVRERPRYAAQWNDDFHHACHVLITGECDGYYIDYADKPVAHLARCLCEGFAYQGEESRFNGVRRGEPSSQLPLTSFISFLQNHDQVGNRAFGERLVELSTTPALRAATSVMLLSPGVPGLFMGEEFGCRQPFLFFADFEGDLAEAVRQGRRKEFAAFAQFGDGGSAGAAIPDPIAVETFERSVLQWDKLAEPEHAEWVEFYRQLLDLRRRFVVPHLPPSAATAPQFLGERGLRITWKLEGSVELTLLANLGDETLQLDAGQRPPGRLLHAQPGTAGTIAPADELPPWTAIWHINDE
ncbi:MAG TPA: malto-oligosyltrehalose trehalohydrolase [Woeseiaceae bacterium]|nr:malto-oligosyltrehalose trehalohydrolase [Woeseiaceae bacterium]